MALAKHLAQRLEWVRDVPIGGDSHAQPLLATSADPATTAGDSSRCRHIPTGRCCKTLIEAPILVRKLPRCLAIEMAASLFISESGMAG